MCNLLSITDAHHGHSNPSSHSSVCRNCPSIPDNMHDEQKDFLAEHVRLGGQTGG
jgi:hypothetical protein